MNTVPRTINKTAKLLRITHDAYLNIWFDNGCEYLEQNQTGKATELHRLINAFKFSVNFWRWYCMQAEVIDAVFCSAVHKGQTPPTIEAYKLLQLRRQLVIPNPVIDEVIADERARKATKTHKLTA